jgi:hypothetical protein
MMVEFIAFTLLLAIVAIYEILPRHRQLRVRYGLGDRFSITLFGSLFLGFLSLIIIAGYILGFIIQQKDVDYFTFYSSDQITISVTYLDAGLSQLFAAIAIASIFVWIFVRENVRVRNDEALLTVLRELFNKSEYATLTYVIEDNYVPLVNHPKKPNDPSQESWAELLSTDDDSETLTGTPNCVSKALDSAETRVPIIGNARDSVGQKIQRVQYWIGLIRYRLANTAEEASGYTERILSNEEFASRHPILNPDLGIKVIEDDDLDGNRRKEITDQYLRTQLRTKNSLLYRDLKNNRAITHYRFRIDSENRLLHALLADCSRASELVVGKSIGESVRAVVREQGEQEHDRYLKRNLSESSYESRYSDQVYIGIVFIDILVREAFFQRLTHHM